MLSIHHSFLNFTFLSLLLLKLFFLSACHNSQKSETVPSDLGSIDFPATGEEGAQSNFIRGVAALHNFWYPEAITAFQKAQKTDPAFVMAYWGEAMSYNHTLWQYQDMEAAWQVLNKLGKNTEERLARADTDKEKTFIKSLHILYNQDVEDKLARDIAYMEFMKDFSKKYPEDNEVAAFYALSILGILRNYQGNEKERMQAAAIAQQIMLQNPRHPGAVHYLIHAVDDPKHAPLGLAAANTYAEIAPSSNHALHMPSHIYVQLGMWQEAAKSNIKAYAASQEWVENKELPATSLDNHSLAWLVYAYEQLGKFKEAEENIKLLEFLNKEEVSDERSENYEKLMRARFIVESGNWKLLPVPDNDSSKAGYDSYVTSSWLLAIGLSAAMLTKIDTAEKVKRKIEEIRILNDTSDQDYYTKLIRINELALAGMIEKSKGNYKQVLQSFQKAIAIEEGMNEPTGPPDIVKPIHELYGEVLEQLNRPKESMKQFTVSLQRMPNRSASLLGMARAAVKANKLETAFVFYNKFLKNWEDADKDLPELIEARKFIEENKNQKFENMISYSLVTFNQPIDRQLKIAQCLNVVNDK